MLEELIKTYKKASKGLIDAQKHAQYAITYHSTVMEGSSLSESQVVNLLDLNITAKNKSFQDHLMVSDHHKAFLFLVDQTKNKTPISPSFIQKIASLVMANTGGITNVAIGSFDSTKGDFRLCSVRAGVRTFPDYKKIPSELSSICKSIQKELQEAHTLDDKINISFYAHFKLVSLHPFGDGNGRTSRLLMNYILMLNGLPPFAVFKNDKIKYINALEESRNKESIIPFILFMRKQYVKFLKSEIKDFNH